MKKFILLFVAVLALSSCDNNDDSFNFVLDYVTTDSADLPTEFVVGETYTITINYTKPTTCYDYYALEYAKSTEEIDDADDVPVLTEVRTIAVINTVDTDCTDITDVGEAATVEFPFTPEEVGPYLFKFWIGVDDVTDENIFLEHTIQAVE